MKRRLHLKGPHNLILLSFREGADEDGAYAEFHRPPGGVEFLDPSGKTFTTTGEDLQVYFAAPARA